MNLLLYHFYVCMYVCMNGWMDSWIEGWKENLKAKDTHETKKKESGGVNGPNMKKGRLWCGEGIQ